MLDLFRFSRPFYSGLRETLKSEIEEIRKSYPDFKPGLAIVQV